MERRNSGAGILFSVLAVQSGYWLGYAFGRLSEDTDKEVREKTEQVQLYNQQIESELAPTFGDIEDLILKIGDKTLTFVSDDRECIGSFEAIEQTARLAGNVSCTALVVEGNS